jgi:gliding motility-associated-like protein
MKKIILQKINAKFFLILITTLISINSEAQNLITNGNFEGAGGNFIVDGYTLINTPNGTSSPGSYTKTTDPKLMNSNYISGGDHTTGTGKMLVFDGSNAGAKFFWGTGGPSPIGGFTIGKTYTFSYWIKAVSNDVTNSATRTNIQIYIIGGSNFNPAGLTQLGPIPSEGWKKISYSFVATATSVMVRLQTVSASTLGNDFAVDDFSITQGAMPLTGSVDKVNPICPSDTGSITVNLTGGTLPYGTYSLTDGSITKTSSNGIFTGLAGGTYTVSVTDAASLPFTQSNIAIAAPNDLVVSAPTSTCAGQPVSLSVSGGANSFTWTASPADPSLTSPNSANPTVSPLVTTTYTVTSGTASNPTNLVPNGDFSQGNVGFISEYSYITDPTVYGTQTAYDIVTNPNSWFSPFSNMADHTTGNGKLMVLDGATDPAGDFLVWRNDTPITVVPNKDYTFSYYIASVASGNPAQMEVFINGVSLGTPVSAPITPGSWILHTFNWNSGTNTTATISLIDREIQGNGNDFALDDISLKAATTCAYQKSVTVAVAPIATPTLNITQPVCGVLTETIEVATPLNTNYEYSLDNGTFQAGVIFNSVAEGNHTITIRDIVSGCSSAPFTVTITPTAVTPTVANFSYTTPVCKNAAVNPTPTTVAGFTTGGTFAATPVGLSIDSTTGAIDLSSSAAGTYAVTYTVAANAAICLAAGNFTANIVINPVVTPVTTVSYNTPVCFGEANPLPTTAAALTSGGTYYVTPAGISINPTTGEINLASSTSGTYTVTYAVAADAATCQTSNSSTAPIVISHKIEVALSGDCNGSNFVLTAAPVNNSFDPNTVTYSWEGSSGNNVGNTKSIIVTKPDTYTVKITSGVCSNSADTTVNAITCVIQKGISPNNDSKNDTFKLTGFNVKNLSIFNRYGEKVYSLQNYTDQWGGQSDKGDELPDGTYYYVIDRDNGEAITGWIYINRAQ